MKLGIMQPYFFPYTGYWQLINAVDTFVIYDDVNFIKGGWINRNNILIGGKARLINIQLHKASPNKLINEVEVLGNNIFSNKLLKTIKHYYKKAPYFDKAYPIIEDIMFSKEPMLHKFLENLIRKVAMYLEIETDIILSTDINKNNCLRGQDKILQICDILGANEYYNAIGGQELYSADMFRINGIELKFLRSKKIKYKQFDNEFIPNLSIIDVMMFNEPSVINEMLDNYELL